MALAEATRSLFRSLHDIAKVHGRVVNDNDGTECGTTAGADSQGFPTQTALALALLSKQLVTALLHDNDQNWPAATLSNLADATRTEPLWRRYFGLAKRVTKADGLPTELEPDCILEVARFVVSSELCNRHSDLLRPALRLTANCCADNNTNRSLFVHRNGIESLKHLALQKRELDVLLPTIFNVCTDYDEVAMDSNGIPMRVDDQMGESVEVSMAEVQLGRCVDFPEGQTTSIEMWCSVPANNESFLANLFELSSRPALYGGIEALSKATSDILEKTRMICTFLIRAQNFEDVDDAEEKMQSRHSIYIACMNLLSSPDAKVMLAQSPTTFWRFAQLFWEMESSGTTQVYQEAFLKIIYSITELPEFSTTVTVESEAFEALIHHYTLIATAQGSSVQQIQSITVMLVNCLTSAERLDRALERFPDLPSTTAKILDCAMYYDHKLPAVALATRFAMNPTGQRHLLATTIHDDLDHALTRSMRRPTNSPDAGSAEATSTTPNTLPFQRTAIPLARYLIKAQPLSALSHFSLLHSTILDLFSSTVDATTKHEISLYCIEVLRCLKQHPFQPTVDIPLLIGFDTTNPKFVAAILSLISDPPTDAVRSEGIFALTLLLSSADFSTAAATSSIEPVLAVAENLVLPVVRDLARPGPLRTAALQRWPSRADQDNLKALTAQLVKVVPVEMKMELQLLLQRWAMTEVMEGRG